MKWITCDEKLPEITEPSEQTTDNVLVTLRFTDIDNSVRYEVATDFYCYAETDEESFKHGWQEDTDEGDYKVVAWMPYPEPYPYAKEATWRY